METWRAIDGFPGYEVSDEGRVRNWNQGGRPAKVKKWRETPKPVSLVRQSSGHMKVWLGHKTARWVHRLVAIAFIGPSPNGMQVAHNDGDPSNNSVQNLRWATPKENCADKRRHGTHLVGSDCNRSRLTTEDVRHILSDPTPPKLIAAQFGVSPQTIWNIRAGRTWAHLVSK